MTDSINNVNLSDFMFVINIAKEKASELLDSDDPQVIATLANTYALLGATKAVDSVQAEMHERLNFIIDALQKDEA